MKLEGRDTLGGGNDFVTITLKFLKRLISKHAKGDEKCSSFGVVHK